jgi:hypothetical protein
MHHQARPAGASLRYATTAPLSQHQSQQTMTDTEIVPTRQAIEAKDRSAPGKVTGKLRAALIEMVWKGSRRDAAAQAAGMSIHGLREALRKPHVKAFYLGELGALRESERPRTFHRLVELRDQNENRGAAVAAARTLEVIPDELQQRSLAAAQTPGVTIRIIQVAAPVSAPMVDVTPEREPRE